MNNQVASHFCGPFVLLLQAHKWLRDPCCLCPKEKTEESHKFNEKNCNNIKVMFGRSNDYYLIKKNNNELLLGKKNGIAN